MLADTAAAPLARVHAIQGLAQIARRGGDGTAESDTGITPALADPDWQIRMVAARSLGDLRSMSAATPLATQFVKLLDDEHGHVRAAAAIAIGRIAAAGDTAHAGKQPQVEPLPAAIMREAAAPGGFDPYARHALVMAVAGVADPVVLTQLAAVVAPDVLRHAPAYEQVAQPQAFATAGRVEAVRGGRAVAP